MTRVRGVLALVVCGGIVLAGCGAKTQQGSQPQPITSTRVVASGTGPQSTVRAVKVPEQLQFAAKTLDGKDFSGTSLAGKRAVLWFWAPWCPKCQGEAEDIAAAAKETADSVRFVGVAALDKLPAMQKFVDKYGLGSFPHLDDENLVVWKRFGVAEQPAYAFVKADGTVETVLKQLPTNQLLDRIRALARG